MVCAIARQLLVPLVHLLHLKRAEPVLFSALINSADQVWIRIGTLGRLTASETQDGRHEHSQVGHNDALSIISLFFAMTTYRLQMLPNGLSTFQVSIATRLDEAHMDHDLCHGYFRDRSILIDFKLAQHLIQVCFKASH